MLTVGCFTTACHPRVLVTTTTALNYMDMHLVPIAPVGGSTGQQEQIPGQIFITK